MKAKRPWASLSMLPFLLLISYLVLALSGAPPDSLADHKPLKEASMQRAPIETHTEDVAVRFVTLPPTQITPTLAYTMYLPVVKTSPIFVNSDNPVAIVYYWDFTASEQLFIYGELKNQSEVTVDPWWSIEVDFFDETGNYRGTRDVHNWMRHLPPEETTCFGNHISSPPIGWAYYEIGEVEFDETTPLLDDVIILESQGVYDPVTKDYTIWGLVQNIGTETRNSVEVVITVYETNGLVTGCTKTDIQKSHLDPGEIGDFEAVFLSWYRDQGNITSYRLQVVP